ASNHRRLAFDLLEDRVVPTVTAYPDFYQAPHGAPYTGSSVLANDTNTNPSSLHAMQGLSAMHGSVNLFYDGTFVYTPNAGYTGTDTFSYYAVDSNVMPEEWDVTTVTINVVNTPPTIGDNQSLSTLHDQEITGIDL